MPPVDERGETFDQKIEVTRRIVDRTLAAGSVSPTQLDHLEERIHLHGKQYIQTPPPLMLAMLLSDLEEVQALAGDRQPAAVQVRLSEMTALMSILVADALMKLGSLRHARAWFATARTAADDSGNLELRGRVRAQAAMLPYYYGPLEAAVRLAKEARMLLRRPSPAAALAAAAEARALARLGEPARAEAERAIDRARASFEQCPQTQDDDDAFAFPERRLLLYLSGAYTFLGHNRRARDAQQQALALYPNHTGIDPAFLLLEAAVCLAREHSVSEACQLAGTTYLQVPDAHRTPILGARAKHVIEVIPHSKRSQRATRELSEILALPSG
jgi:tetratricopeptide (TPR) repeat protein